MNKDRRYKLFNLPAALAMFGAVVVLLFECAFVFELYNADATKIVACLPEWVRSYPENWLNGGSPEPAPVWVPAEDSKAIPEPVEVPSPNTMPGEEPLPVG